MAQVSFETHKGIAVYPWLNKADTEYNTEGQFKTGLRVPADQAKELIDKCKELAQEEFGGKKAAAAKMPWKQDEDTGELIINVKSKFKPKFYDADGTYIPEHYHPQVWGGSVLRVGGHIIAYNTSGNMGISLRLSKVQVVELAEREDSGGFGAVEGGGFTHKESSNEDAEEKEGFTADF